MRNVSDVNTLVYLVGKKHSPYIFDAYDKIIYVNGRWERMVATIEIAKNFFILLPELMKFIIQTPILSICICYPLPYQITRIIIFGFSLIGIAGFMGYFYWFTQEIVRNGPNRHLINRLIMLAIWISSLGSKEFSRVTIFAGCLVVSKDLYVKLNTFSRIASNWLGDQILEPSIRTS